MPPTCGAKHPTYPDVTCTLEKHGTNNHTHNGEDGTVINWKGAEKNFVVHSRASLEQVIGDHKVKLQQTMDEIQSSSGLARDLINTLVPPMQTQLFLIEQVLKMIEDKPKE